MKLPLRYYFLCVLLILLSTLTLSCQRLEPLRPFIRPVPPLIRLSPDQYPLFQDNGNEEALKKALENQIRYMDERIADFDERLTSRKNDLYQEFLAMESALSQYEAEGAYLESQLQNLQSNFNTMYNRNR